MPTKKSPNLFNGISSYTSKASLALPVKVQVANPIEVTSQSNTAVMANAVKTSVKDEAPAGEARTQKFGKHELRVYNQSRRGPTNFQVPAQKCVNNKRPKENLSRWKSHQEATKDSFQKNTKPTPISTNEALKSTLPSIDNGSVVIKVAKAKGKRGKRSIVSEKSPKEDGIAEDASTIEIADKPTSYLCLEETRQLLNYLEEEAASTKSENALSQRISKNGALNKNSTNESVEQETRNLKKASKSASKPVNIDTATRVQPVKHGLGKQSSTTAAKVDKMKDSSSNKRVPEVTTKSNKTWKRREQRKRARVKEMQTVTETEEGEVVSKSAVTGKETAADINTQVKKIEDSAPSKVVSKVIRKPSKAKIRRDRRKRALLRKKMTATVAVVSKAIKKTEQTSDYVPVDTSTSKVYYVDATLSKEVEVRGPQADDHEKAAIALGKGTKRSKLQKRNPAAQNVKPEEKENPTETHTSPFQSLGKSASRPESGATASKIDPAKELEGAHPLKVVGEQSLPSIPIVPWIVRERKRRKEARRRKIQRKTKIVSGSLSNRWIQLGVAFAAVLLLALFVLFYCYF